MRAVIYARYSSDLQREASIEDQIEVCRRYAEAQGWSIVGTYKDAAISGASRFRPGFQKLMADAAERRFDRRHLRGDRPARPSLGRHGRPSGPARIPEDPPLHALARRDHAYPCRGHGHDGADGAEGPRREDEARPARASAEGTHPCRNRLRLQNRGCRRRRAGRATDRPRRGRRRSADLQGIRFRKESGGDRARPQSRRRAGTCRPLVVEHDDSRPARSRHRDPEQRSLSRRHRMEPLRLHEESKDRKARRPSQSARTVGARRSPGAAHRR